MENMAEQVTISSSPEKGMAKVLGRLRWGILLLFIVGVTLNYITRNSLGVLAPELKKLFGMSNEQYGYVTVAFQAAYTIFQPICGWFIDFVGLKIGFVVCALLWSLSCMAHAGVGNWFHLIMLRFCMGATEAAASPANVKVMTDWFPKKERAIANGWGGVGFSIGGVLAPPLIIGLHAQFGWQAAFVVPGILSIIWAIAWWKIYDTPAKSRLITPAEREHILEDQDQPAVAAPKTSLWSSLGSLLRTKKFYGIGIPAFLAEPAWQTLGVWVPLYMSQVHGFQLKQIALFAVLPFLMGDLGSLISGYLIPFMRRHFNVGRMNGAILTSCSGAIVMISVLFAAFVKNPYAAVVLISMGGFGHQIISAMLGVLVMETTPRDKVATANGLRGTFAWVAAAISTAAIGAVTTYLGPVGFTYVFICLGLFDLVGATVMITLLWERKGAQQA